MRYLSHLRGRTTDVKISGYADDTAVYLRDRSAVLSVVTILDDFAAVPGLQTNRAKSIIIEIDPRGSSMTLNTCGLQSAAFNRVLPISWCACGPTWCDTCQLVELHTITMESTCTSARILIRCNNDLSSLAPSRCPKLST